MECPCTDKWEKVISSYSTLKEGTCQPDITTAEDCYIAAQELGLRPAKQNSTVANPKLPPGCTVTATVGGFDVIFNTAKSTVTCGDPAKNEKTLPRVAGLAENLVNISIDLNPATDLATITLQGPSNVWFGVGLGAHGKFNPADPSSGLSMFGTNWTLVVLTDGTVMERVRICCLCMPVYVYVRLCLCLCLCLCPCLCTILVISFEATNECSLGGCNLFPINAGMHNSGGVIRTPKDLGNHEAGTELPQSVKMVSTSVKDGSRTVVMTRSIEGSAIDDMKFDPNANSMPFINVRNHPCLSEVN